jgi:opacity protein-like surface antigen
MDLTLGYGVFTRDAVEVGGLVSYLSYEDAGGAGVDLKGWELGGFAEYHFDMATMTVPYIGARVEYVKAELGSWDESAFVYGPRAGIKHFITDNVAVDVALMYMLATEDIFTNEGVLEDNDLSLVFGIRAMF